MIKQVRFSDVFLACKWDRSFFRTWSLKATWSRKMAEPCIELRMVKRTPVQARPWVR